MFIYNNDNFFCFQIVFVLVDRTGYVRSPVNTVRLPLGVEEV
jgi:hypothetical protein